jgi:hypothetical protein
VSEYVVVIKPSARRTARDVGQWVNREGPRRRFASKALAREWARRASGHRARVWVQDAAPHDDTDADGYLVGGDRTASSRADPVGRQVGVGRFDRSQG